VIELAHASIQPKAIRLLQRKTWLFGHKRRTGGLCSPLAGRRVVLAGLQADDLQQELAKMRESGSILIESADARANRER
jgi:hypothetical protein